MNVSKNVYKNNKIKFIDLFAGLGGIRIGFEQALKDKKIKSECVFTSEIKKHAIKAYKNNFKDSNINGDISKIDLEKIPYFDYLLAGFPCQPFSSAGKMLGFLDTRGTLFFEIEKILKNKKPLGFILENVEGLISHNKGQTLRTILNSLSNLGYKVTYSVLNSADFGLAQNRKRVYIIGTKDKTVHLNNFVKKQSNVKDIQEDNLETIKSIFSKQLLKKYKTKDIYGKSITDKRGGINNIHSWDLELKGTISNEQKELLNLLLKNRRKKYFAQEINIDWMDGMPLNIDQIRTFFDHKNLQKLLDDLVQKKYLVFEYPKKLVNNKRKFDVLKQKGYNIVTGKLSFEFSKILDPNSISPTLVATDIDRIGIIDNEGIRKLSIREGLRLFGFPEDYDLSFLKRSEALDLLGNTVCIPVIKEIALKLLNTKKI
ncbi:DNA (cytosine-5-)-methyltransferase [Mycoplasmopsis alligatoris]|uniref:Cytosine-specific methyltransferase n=1 Tax=Mycoplasmopsis alligatoris A21JP2 TaxID=747682 RepID=D4XV26_9BACT|nr:DNA (cytosine-5-)-methyltransferase [Mycoplasmopsis alligatoris]EFF41842.1 DNA (cytosine-5-)-methyltransferase [Mycoplasmopsis alligatoris A21JP2]